MSLQVACIRQTIFNGISSHQTQPSQIREATSIRAEPHFTSCTRRQRLGTGKSDRKPTREHTFIWPKRYSAHTISRTTTLSSRFYLPSFKHFSLVTVLLTIGRIHKRQVAAEHLPLVNVNVPLPNHFQHRQVCQCQPPLENISAGHVLPTICGSTRSVMSV